MKSVQRIIFSILTLVVIMSMANPVFAEEQKKVKLYDTEMNLISTFQSETELENYLENMPALHFEGGCGIDPTRQHGSKTYKSILTVDMITTQIRRPCCTVYIATGAMGLCTS